MEWRHSPYMNNIIQFCFKLLQFFINMDANNKEIHQPRNSLEINGNCKGLTIDTADVWFQSDQIDLLSEILVITIFITSVSYIIC